MATGGLFSAEEIQSEFLSCPICYEIYQHPKCLPCLHSFCRHCLSSYILSLQDYGVVRKKSFPCPMCKKLCGIKGYEKPLGEWADEVMDNYIIQNMLDYVSSRRVMCQTDPERPGVLASILSVFRSLYRSRRNEGGPEPMTPLPSVFLYRDNSAPTIHFTHKTNKWSLAQELRPFDDDVKFSDVCHINDPYNSVAASDYYGCRVVLFRFLLTGAIVRKRKVAVEGGPRSLTLIGEGTKNKCLVVSLHNKNVLVILSIPKLRVIRKLKTEKAYCSVTSLSPFTLLAGSADRPACIDRIELDMNYQINSPITTVVQNRPECMLFLPVKLCALSESSFLVSDSVRKTITCYFVQEDEVTEKMFSISPTSGHEWNRKYKCPGGLCFNKETHTVYAVDFGKDSVFQFEPNSIPILCEPIVDESDGVEMPASVCQTDSDTLCVVTWTGKVLVFTRKQTDLQIGDG